MAGKKRLHKKKGKGHITNRVDKVGPKVLRQLAFGGKTFKGIGKSFNLEPGLVRRLNILYGARPPERVEEIQIMTIRHKLLRHAKARRKKTFYFNPEGKERLFKEHSGKLLKLARWSWTGSESIRKLFGSDFNMFYSKMKDYVSQGLDYYDPQKKGFKGRKAVPLTWMMIGARIFCWGTYDRASMQKEKAMPVDKSGLPKAQTDKAEPTRNARLEPTTPKLEWIPVAAKGLLRKLGLNPRRVARAGFFNIKRQILEIVEAKATGLTEKQKEIIKMRLEGKRARDIAASFKTTLQNIYIIETNAAKKIRREIKKQKIKAKDKK